jgi:outer membrane protein assembly factor BamC
MMTRRSLRLLAGLLAGLSLTACSGVSDKDEAYRQARSVKGLEVPPGLTREAFGNALEVPDEDPALATELLERAGTVLQQWPDVKVYRDRDIYWLSTSADPDKLWSALLDFFLERGFVIRIEQPTLGIIETGWVEVGLDAPKEGFLERAMRSLRGEGSSTGALNRFRARVERNAQSGQSEVHFTHTGIREAVVGDTTVWEPVPARPDLEAELMHRFLLYLGVTPNRTAELLQQAPATPPQLSIGVVDGYPQLQMGGEADLIWRRAGTALERTGLLVQSSNQTAGLYFVRFQPDTSGRELKDYNDPLAKLLQAGQELQLLLTTTPQGMAMQLLDQRGGRLDVPTAEGLLQLLSEQLG